MAINSTHDKLAIPEDMRTKFLITRLPDGSLQGVTWAIAETVESSKGRQHTVKICRSTWVPEYGDFAHRHAWANADRQGKPQPMSVAEAVEELRNTEPELARTPLKSGETISDAYELTDTIAAQFQRHHNELPETLQQARQAIHYDTAVGRQRLVPSVLGDLVPLDRFGQPEPGHTVLNGSLARAQQAAGTLPIKARSKIPIKIQTADIDGMNSCLLDRLESELLKQGPWFARFVHIVSPKLFKYIDKKLGRPFNRQLYKQWSINRNNLDLLQKMPIKSASISDEMHLAWKDRFERLDHPNM